MSDSTQSAPVGELFMPLQTNIYKGHTDRQTYT